MMLACIPALLILQTTPETPAEPRFEVHDGTHVMVWNDQVVLRDLSLEKDGVPLGFQPELVRFKPNGNGFQIRGADREANQLSFRATFALSYEPTIRNSAAVGEGTMQFLVGRTVTANSDLLIDPESGWALHAPGCLDLVFWQEGGPAELNIRLKQKAVLRMGKAADWLGTSQGASMTALRERVAADFKAKKQAVPDEIAQILDSELPGGLKIQAVSAGQSQVAADQPMLANFRIASPTSDVRFDLVVLHNPLDSPRDMAVDYTQLGWEKPKRQRIVVRFPDGKCLGVVKERLDLTVPAKSWQVLMFRPPMPQGIMASHNGPMAALVAPWQWHSSAPERSGTQAYRARYSCENANKQPGWAVLSVAAGRQDALRITGIVHGEDTKLDFAQNGEWARVDLPAAESEQRSLTVLTRGRVTDAAAQGENGD